MFGGSYAAARKGKTLYIVESRGSGRNEKSELNTLNSHERIIPLMHVYSPLESFSSSFSSRSRLIMLPNRKSKQRLAEILCIVWANAAVQRQFLHERGGNHLNTTSLHPWNGILEATERKIRSTNDCRGVGEDRLDCFKIQFDFVLEILKNKTWWDV